jgi:hypothetical protein
MDHFSESELFDEDTPAASPLSVGQPTEALRPSPTGGWPALAAALARRWPACVAGLLVALLAVGLLSGVGRTHPQPSAPDRAHHRDLHHPRHGQPVNHQHSAGKLGRVSVAPPAPKIGAGSGTASDMPPGPVVPRPIRVGHVGTDRPTSSVQVGKMGQTQFDYLGR